MVFFVSVLCALGLLLLLLPISSIPCLLSATMYSCDVTLASNDGQLNQTHKVILSTLSSPYEVTFCKFHQFATESLETIADTQLNQGQIWSTFQQIIFFKICFNWFLWTPNHSLSTLCAKKIIMHLLGMLCAHYNH